MGLESTTLASSSPAERVDVRKVNVELLTLSEVRDAGNLYELAWKEKDHDSARIGYILGARTELIKSREQFVKNLKEDDQFLVVYDRGVVTTVYGPIDKSKLLVLTNF